MAERSQAVERRPAFLHLPETGRAGVEHRLPFGGHRLNRKIRDLSAFGDERLVFVDGLAERGRGPIGGF